MSIGTRIIQLRYQRNITQRELSRRTGLASSYLSRVENRRLEPRPKTLRNIAQALDVPVSELFQESPTSSGRVRCVITATGKCIMEMLGTRRPRRPQPGSESYSPRQLQLLRMANYLIQAGNTKLLDTLEMLLGALMVMSGDRRVAKRFAAGTGKSE